MAVFAWLRWSTLVQYGYVCAMSVGFMWKLEVIVVGATIVGISAGFWVLCRAAVLLLSELRVFSH